MRKWRIIQTLVVSATLAVAMGGAARAFSYSGSVSRDGYLRGQGYGNFYRTGYNTAKLTSTLADMRKDGTRTFSDAKGYAPNKYFGVQSGRRADGESWYARMADKTGYSGGAMVGYTGYVKICQDVSLAPDWCSSEDHGDL